MSDNSYRPFLNELRYRYNQGEVSALIGAGFSKNVYREFPNWDELLYDMIIELFKHEIDDAYSQYRHTAKHSEKTLSYTEYSKSQAKVLSERYGYLGVVSKYIEKHGYRECVDSYIERHIPYLDLKAERLVFQDKVVDIQEDDIRVHKHLLNLSKLNTIFTTNYDNIIEEVAAKHTTMLWEPISSSYDLIMTAVKKQIVKVHGDIRRSESEEFIFDGDHTKRYIISKRDYDTYAQKHEAFMQLMRITLLRERFILFGFSGDDPNFIAWISWVRDVLVKNPKRKSGANSPEDYKIFLFAVDDKEPTDAKAQFYRNHHIKYIPILNSDYLSLLGLTEGYNDIKNIIIKSLEYCALSYNDLWSRATSQRELESEKAMMFSSVYDVDDSYFRRIENDKADNRQVKNISQQKHCLLQGARSNSISESFAKLLVLALRDTKLPVSCYGFQDKLEAVLVDCHYRSELDALKSRFDILAFVYTGGDSDDYTLTNSDFEQDYNTILKVLFAFDFSRLKELLDEWKPTGVWVQSRAALYSIFDANRSVEMINEYAAEENNRQEQVNLQCLLFSFKQNISIKLPYDRWNSLGLSNMFDIKDSLVNQLNKSYWKSNGKLTPYGQGGRTISFGGGVNESLLTSIRLVQHFIDSGIFPSVRRCTYMNAEDWYMVVKVLLKYFPFPILWYTLFYNNNNLLKRVAQEYVYEDTLKDDIPYILQRLFKAFFDENTPAYVKESILKFIPHLFISVRVSEWVEYVLRIWRDVYLPNLGSSKTDPNISSLLNTALKYFTDPNAIHEIVESCIDNATANKGEITGLIGSLYHRMNCLDADEFRVKIDNLIERICRDDCYSVLHNLKPLLSENQVKQIKLNMAEFIRNTEVINYRTFESLAFFATRNGDDEVLLESIKQAIIKHPKLWSNGKLDRGYTDPMFIEIHELKLDWTIEEARDVINRLLDSYGEIKCNLIKDIDASIGFIVNYQPLLCEMNYFIERNCSSLKFTDIETKMLLEIKQNLIKSRGYDKLYDGLISPDREVSILANNEFVNMVNCGWSIDYLAYVETIIDRVSLKPDLLDVYLQGVSFFAAKHFEDINKEDIIRKLRSILIVYKTFDWRENNVRKDKAYEYLVSLASSLKQHSEEGDEIDYWLGQQDRFIYNYGR